MIVIAPKRTDHRLLWLRPLSLSLVSHDHSPRLPYVFNVDVVVTDPDCLPTRQQHPLMNAIPLRVGGERNIKTLESSDTSSFCRPPPYVSVTEVGAERNILLVFDTFYSVQVSLDTEICITRRSTSDGLNEGEPRERAKPLVKLVTYRSAGCPRWRFP